MVFFENEFPFKSATEEIVTEVEDDESRNRAKIFVEEEERLMGQKSVIGPQVLPSQIIIGPVESPNGINEEIPHVVVFDNTLGSSSTTSAAIPTAPPVNTVAPQIASGTSQLPSKIAVTNEELGRGRRQ